MANLFFVHTPFQLLVAQQVILQEGLSNNILLYGYVGSNSHFLRIYEIVKIDNLWAKCIEFPKIAEWASIDLHRPLTSPLSIIQSYHRLKKIFIVEGVNNIYLGDINNFTQRFLCVLYSKMGLRVSFFEEGTSHYTYQSHNLTNLNKFTALGITHIYDLCFYLPYFGLRYARYRFIEDLPIEKLPMYQRFNMLDVNQETFDKKLHYSLTSSNKVNDYIRNECRGLDLSNSVLFLDQPIFESVPGSLPLYIDTVEEYIKKLNKGTNVIIKFHPREDRGVKDKLIELFTDAGVDFKVISMDINLPIELYLQVIQFKEVISIYSSTVIYNGIMYPFVKYTYLLPLFYSKVKQARLKDTCMLDNFMSQLNNIKQKR